MGSGNGRKLVISAISLLFPRSRRIRRRWILNLYWLLFQHALHLLGAAAAADDNSFPLACADCLDSFSPHKAQPNVL